MDYQKWRELDDVRLLGDLPSPLAQVALELLNPLLLQVHLQALSKACPSKQNSLKCHHDFFLPVWVLWQGQGQVGEFPVGDRFPHADEALHHWPVAQIYINVHKSKDKSRTLFDRRIAGRWLTGSSPSNSSSASWPPSRLSCLWSFAPACCWVWPPGQRSWSVARTISCLTLLVSSWSHSSKERRNSWESCWSRPANSVLARPTLDLRSEALMDLYWEDQRCFRTCNVTQHHTGSVWKTVWSPRRTPLLCVLLFYCTCR